MVATVNLFSVASSNHQREGKFFGLIGASGVEEVQRQKNQA
jgi:hypothetical protein